MASQPDVLFSCLVSDLAPYLPPSKVSGTNPWLTFKQCASQLQLDAFLRKFEGKVDPTADDAAADKFFAVNKRCGDWQPRWESWEDELVGTLKQCIYEFFTPSGLPLVSNFDEILDHADVGPGASLGALANDFYTKMFASPLTTTSEGLYSAYSSYIQQFPEWLNAEDKRLELYGEPDIVLGNRLHFVPKRTDISRVICIEPSLNMFFQLGLKCILEDRLRDTFGIDFEVQQERSRELARLGSLHDTYVTIDLESASDSLSVRMIEELFPRDFVTWLKLFRSPTCEDPRTGARHVLNMISTMGNGTTFPLQTILFTCIVSAVARYRGLPLEKSRGKSLGNFSVFGDDIIVEKSFLPDVLRLLRLLGFVINDSKTFVEGPFRESCGGDFFRGHPVRPFYLRRIDSQQDRYVAINMLNRWSSKTGIFLPKTIRYLLRGVERRFIPPFENLEAGISVPSTFVGKQRRCRKTGSILYRTFLPRPNTYRIGEGDVHLIGRRRVFSNPSGLLLAFLRGTIVSGSISVRHNTVRYRTKWKITPYWDYLPDGSPIAGEYWERWNTAVYFNLYG